MKKIQPKPLKIKKIKFEGEEIGYVKLVKYLSGFSIKHIEFAIEKRKFRGRGIMKKELKKYLSSFFFKPKLIATPQGYYRKASTKLLLDNGFKRAFVYRKTWVYTLNVSPKRAKKEIKILKNKLF